jgi:hypothetical protein
LDLWSKAKEHFRESSGHEKMIKTEVACWKPEGKSVFEWKDNIQVDFNEMYFGTELTDIKIKPNGGVS